MTNGFNNIFKIQIGCDPEMREMDMACSHEDDTWDTVPCRSGFGKNSDDTTESTARNEEVILQREIGEFLYSVTASVFFQANDFMVSDLVSLVLESARNNSKDPVLDLYAGVGLFSLPPKLRLALW